jgi:hypothetical protein
MRGGDARARRMARLRSARSARARRPPRLLSLRDLAASDPAVAATSTA